MTRPRQLSPETASIYSWVELARAFATGGNRADLCRPVFDRILVRSGWQEGALYILHDGGSSVERLVAAGTLDAGGEKNSFAAQRVVNRALHTGRPQDLDRDALAALRVDGTPFEFLRRARVIPLHVAGRALAALVLADASASTPPPEAELPDLDDELGLLSLILVLDPELQGGGKSDAGGPKMLALQALSDLIPQMVLVKDLENRVLVANARAGEFYRLHPRQMEGEFLWEIDPLNAAAAFRADLEVVSSGELKRGQLEPTTGLHGESLWLRVDRAPVFGPEGKIVAVVTALEDVTEQLLAQQRLEESIADAARAERRRDQYLRALADEVREPLRQVQKRLTQLGRELDGSPGASVIEELVAIQHQSLVSIQDLLDFSRVENGNLAVQSHDFEVEELLTEVLEACQRTAARRDIRLASRVAPQCPSRVAGDSNRVRQILIQLLGCALRVARGGEVFVMCSPLADTEAPRLRFEVRAPSATLQPRELEEYFASYRSEAEAGPSQNSSHELRLALARSLTHLLGGDVQVEVAADRSFCCSCDLPLRAPIESAPSSRSRVPRAGARVLLCEPNENMRAIHQQRLRDLQLVVDAASTPRLAAEMVRAAGAAGWPFDAVLIQADSATDVDRVCIEIQSCARGRVARMVDGPQEDSGSMAPEILRLPWRQRELQELLTEVCGPQPIESEEEIGRGGELGGRFEFLVLDDNAMRRGVTSFALRRIGGRVVLAETQNAALDLLEATDFDLVLVDEDWLNQGHRDFVDHVRRVDGRQRRTRVAVGVHEKNVGQSEDLAALGYDGCMVKPLDTEALLRVVSGTRVALA